MPEDFDKLMYDLADAANEEIDYEGMRLAIKARARAARIKRTQRFRVWGAAAACFVLLLALGTLLNRRSAVPEAASAAEAPMLYAMDTTDTAAEAAPAAEESAVALPAPTLAEAPALPGAAAGAAENAPEAALDGRTSGPQFDKEAMRAAYPTLLVNRAVTIGAEAPASLVDIAQMALPDNVTLKKESMTAYPDAAEAFIRLLTAAQNDGVEHFYLASAYRSFEEQSAIWNNKIAREPDYGKDGAPVASLPPGQSEHETGLALDITCLAHPSLSAGFADTEQAQWLFAHAHEFGFILRYPAGKEAITGVIYEPWHYRYVGEDLAWYLWSNELTLEEFYNE